jgi:hypothetical protein
MTIDEKKETYNKYYEEYKKQKDVLTWIQDRVSRLRRTSDYFEKDIKQDEFKILIKKYNTDKYRKIAKECYWVNKNKITQKHFPDIVEIFWYDYEYITREQEAEVNEFQSILEILLIN